MSPQGFLHHRPDLARSTADSLLGQSLFGHQSGLFLAAPRRTGKSTFLRHDLIPELERRDVLTVYVDLWKNRDANPASLISDAIATALADADTRASAKARRAGLKKLKLGPVTLDLGNIGKPDGITISDALQALMEASGKSVALIVDEAQHALSSPAGETTMFALKAARDQLSSGDTGQRLALVFTGSHRDKLAALVLNRQAPFYGAAITDFPLLGKGYATELTTWTNERLSVGHHFDPAEVDRAFEIVARRPELLQAAMRDVVMPLGDQRISLLEAAGRQQTRLTEEYESRLAGLSAVETAVLLQLAKDGRDFSPYAAASLDAYAAATGKTVSVSKAQRALETLRENGLVWRAGTGAYALEEQEMADWLLNDSGLPLPKTKNHKTRP